MTDIMSNAEGELDPMYERYRMPLLTKEHLDPRSVAYTFVYRHLDVRVEMWPGGSGDQNTIYQAFVRPRGPRRLINPLWSPVTRGIAGPGTTTTTIDELMMNVVASVVERQDVQRALEQLRHWPDDYPQSAG